MNSISWAFPYLQARTGVWESESACVHVCVWVCWRLAFCTESSQNLCKFCSVGLQSPLCLCVCSCVRSAYTCAHMAFVLFCMSEESLAQLDTSAVDSHTHNTHITHKWQMMEHLLLMCLCVCALNIRLLTMFKTKVIKSYFSSNFFTGILNIFNVLFIWRYHQIIILTFTIYSLSKS